MQQIWELMERHGLEMVWDIIHTSKRAAKKLLSQREVLFTNTDAPFMIFFDSWAYHLAQEVIHEPPCKFVVATTHCDH